LLQRVVAYPEYGSGSCPALAMEIMDVVGYLVPTPADPTRRTIQALRV
jgi:hypothetical protein